MASFIYIYSKFTEEFLLLTAAGIFFFLALYCYHWVVKKRRLGAARDQIPAGMVKVYLNQLINEAQFVRTQLFGLLGAEAGASAENLARFQMTAAPAAGAPASTTSFSSSDSSPIPSDLLERLKALEAQLADKESMVVNINVEKTRLAEEVTNLKQNQDSLQQAAGAGNPDLSAKVKALEERLEEYALFEDDLANLKRLQQENASLKKRLDQMGDAGTASAPAKEATPAPTLSVAPAPAPVPKSEPAPEPKMEASTPSVSEKGGLDQAAIDALLNGSSPIAPEPVAKKEAAKNNDDFEKLIDSVEDSLTAAPAAEPAKPAPAPAPVKAAAPAAPAQAASDATGSKTDEELLKEFENLLNS